MRNITILLLLVLMSCAEDPMPKPRGYFRIGLPDKTYELRDSLGCPYAFEANTSSTLIIKKNCWADLEYPSIKASVKLTYYNFDDKPLEDLIRDGQRMAYSHTVKAEGMFEQPIINEESRVFGMLYQMRGQVATSTQFYVTDSAQHFLRGVLYFYSQPDPDSLKPVNDFMKDEIVRMIETLEWRNG